MTKTIRISDSAHGDAKRKAERCGLKIARFIEMAIERFDPVVSLKRADAKKPARNRRPDGES